MSSTQAPRRLSGREILDGAARSARRAQVEALVRQGLSEREIANKLGVSRTTVWTDKQVINAVNG